VTPTLWFIVESGTDVRLVEGLAERGPLTVLARRIPGGREISQPTSAVSDIRTGPASFLRFGAHVALTMLRERRAIRMAVVQGYGVAALCANVAARLARIPVVMLVCSPTEAYYACRRIDGGAKPFRAFEWAGLRRLAWLNARVGQRYLVLSEYLASVVRAHGTLRPVDVVPLYGVDTRVFSPSTRSREELRRELGLPVGPSLVFFSSRVAPEKDPDTLLAAVGSLRAAGRDVRILHRSGGHGEFLRRAHLYGVHEAVIEGPAIPPGPALATYYRASDLCVQASREEGLGFSPLEALACGVPVIAAAVGGLRETIVEGRTGWTYGPGDAQALARAIAQALDNPAEARRRTQLGRALVTSRYDRDVVFAQFEALAATLRPQDGESGRPMPWPPAA
jgi:glycosyltransferase involved in cell wall biosynthesis